MSIHSRMVDACRITRASSDRVFNPNTGEYTTPPPATIYEGPCLVREMSVQDGRALIGERIVTVKLYNAYLPLSVAAVRKDDAFVVTKSSDPQLVDRPLEVESFAVSSRPKARRLVLEEIR
jgi:hypothetical protein